MKRIQHALIALGVGALLMLPTVLVNRYNVCTGANTALFKYHYYMLKEGIDLPMNYTYKITFNHEWGANDPIGMARGMFKERKVDIILNAHWWKILSENERKVLLYHELSHDLLGIVHQHCDKESIMYPSRQGMKIKDADEMVKDLLRKYKEGTLKCKYEIIAGPFGIPIRIPVNESDSDSRCSNIPIFLDEVIVTN